MISQVKRQKIGLLLKESDRSDLIIHIAKVWEDWDDDDEVEKTIQSVFDKLLSLYPEKKIFVNNIIKDDDDDNWDELFD